MDGQTAAELKLYGFLFEMDGKTAYPSLPYMDQMGNLSVHSTPKLLCGQITCDGEGMYRTLSVKGELLTSTMHFCQYSSDIHLRSALLCCLLGEQSMVNR